MISISAPEAVIIVGICLGFLGLVAPDRLLAWQKLDASTLVVSGIFVGLTGLVLEVIF